MKLNEVKMIDILDHLVCKYNVSEFINTDPIQFPRKFVKLQDIEIAAFLVATITWGRRSMIIRNAEKILSEMNYRPYDYIINGEFKHGKESLHRTFKWNDFAEICIALQSFYHSHESLESLFSSQKDELDLSRYKYCFLSPRISDWEKGSASKRLHMFLRWMVRNDGIVDIGCWKTIHPSFLFIPLDTHVARIARKFDLLDRKTNDRKAVELLTDQLRKLCPEDPVKYDFALFGPGVSSDEI